MGLGKKFDLCVTDLEDSSSFEEECVQESIEICHTIIIREIFVYDNIELLKSLDEQLSNEELLQLETFSCAEKLDVIDSFQIIEHHVNVKDDLLSCLKSAQKSDQNVIYKRDTVLQSHLLIVCLTIRVFDTHQISIDDMKMHMFLC